MGDLEVEAGAGVLGHAAVLEVHPDVGLVGRLVLAEAGVAVDAVDHLLGLLGHIVHRERAELVGDQPHQFQRRPADLLLVELLVGGEPVAVVVLLQLPEEPESLGRESRESHAHKDPSSPACPDGQ